MQRSPLNCVAFIIDGEKYELDGDQLASLNKWLAEMVEKIDEKHRREGRGDMAEHFKSKGEVYAGVSDGNLTFAVTPTSIGTVFKVAEAITGEKIDLTNYDNW